MSISSNIVVKDYDPLTVAKVEVASGTVIASGDLIAYSSADTVATVYTGVKERFLGVALVGSESGKTDFVSVATRAKVNTYAVDAGYLGDSYYRSAGANGTNWTFTNGPANGVLWALEDISATSYGDFYIDSHVLLSGLLFEATT